MPGDNCSALDEWLDGVRAADLIGNNDERTFVSGIVDAFAQACGVALEEPTLRALAFAVALAQTTRVALLPFPDFNADPIDALADHVARRLA